MIKVLADKIKSDLSDNFTKGSDNYPITPVQTLLLLDKYLKKHTVVVASEGTAGDVNVKRVEFNKDFYKDK